MLVQTQPFNQFLFGLKKFGNCTDQLQLYYTSYRHTSGMWSDLLALLGYINRGLIFLKISKS
jgi:hypothetical protein